LKKESKGRKEEVNGGQEGVSKEFATPISVIGGGT
jgi:hypothetical protein